MWEERLINRDEILKKEKKKTVKMIENTAVGRPEGDSGTSSEFVSELYSQYVSYLEAKKKLEITSFYCSLDDEKEAGT